MRNECNLIKDILPLYVEDMVSADTKEFVCEHLEHCQGCQEEYERMRRSAKFVPDADMDTDAVPLKRIKRNLLRKRLQIIFFTAVLACAMAAVAFGVLTSPKFFPYSDDLLDVTGDSDGDIIITFDDEVTGYSCVKEFDSETGAEVYHISAWTTNWDAYLSNRGKQNTVIFSGGEAKIQIFYAQNDGSEDVLIYGLNDKDEGVMTLPRLILLPYFLLASLALAVLVVLRFLLRNKQAAIVWIDRSLPLPISYMAAQLCTKGFSFMAYSAQRDVCIIILVAMLLYFAMLTGKSLYKARKGSS